MVGQVKASIDTESGKIKECSVFRDLGYGRAFNLTVWFFRFSMWSAVAFPWSWKLLQKSAVRKCGVLKSRRYNWIHVQRGLRRKVIICWIFCSGSESVQIILSIYWTIFWTKVYIINRIENNLFRRIRQCWNRLLWPKWLIKACLSRWEVFTPPLILKLKYFLLM